MEYMEIGEDGRLRPVGAAANGSDSAAARKAGWRWWVWLIIVVVVLVALVATAYFLREQLTDLTGIDLVTFFEKTKQTVGLVDKSKYDAEAIQINFAPDACPEQQGGPCGATTKEMYVPLKKAYEDATPGVVHCGETCEASSGGVAKWARPDQLRGYRYRQSCVARDAEANPFGTATLTHVNTNNPLEVKVPSGPGTYELTIDVGDCQFPEDSFPRLDLVQDGEIASRVPLITDDDSLVVDMQVAQVVREVRITGETFRLVDPRTPHASAAVGTGGEQVQPQGVAIVYVHRKGQESYSVKKADVAEVVSKVAEVLPGSQLAAQQDIQAMASSDIAHCACGWVKKTRGSANTDLTSGYPSIPGTSTGCGGGQRGFMSCSDDGPDWVTDRKAGVYFVVRYSPLALSEIKPLLETKDLTGTVLPYFRVVQPTRISGLGVKRIL